MLGYKASVNMIIVMHYCIYSVNWTLVTCLYS